MTESNSPQLFWDLVKDFDTSMVVTRDAGRMRARPMAPRISADQREILFLTDRNSHKVEEIEANSEVVCTFAKHGRYASVTGRARVSGDRDLVASIWNAEAEAWMPKGKEHPDVVVLAIAPEQAELWDVKTNSVTKAWEFAKAYLGEKPQPDIGEHRKVGF
ncbi:pyridoxamine 5'-phosphate oxidase family protein [Mangrovibrevibacter kandeliae]|uniref:pyridoxamine 5'-phosphate oxidase family protein n=1 Tax=Mangrovibrevibacter kandeliae TaxID=2968473 RepID=UPI002118D08B|nr:pyridoxamine 5'-phosphate oxidase family protein [Aurantimonas sp. CSK15Z-1]MCQ8782210.1 pyridoxamine 5'-phosphate oxidase family protein [Aurantimonas sp. CSK15Z-1]